jgi:hypothetical protein
LRVLGIDTVADVIVNVAVQLCFDLLLGEALISGGSQQASDQFLNLGPTAPHAEWLVSMHAVVQPKLYEFLCRGHRDTPFQPQVYQLRRRLQQGNLNIRRSTGTSAGAKCCSSINDGFSKAAAAAPSPSGEWVPTTGYSLIPASKDNAMFRRKVASFRNAIDLKDKVQVKVLRKRLKLSEAQLMAAIRKSGNSIAALVKEAAN